MKRLSKKSIALLLLAVMLASTLLYGCQKGNGSETGTTPPANTDVVTAEEKLILPEEHDYDGYEFKALVAGNYANNDFEIADGAADIVSEAKAKKNLQVESELNVVITNVDKVAFGSTRGAGPGFMDFQQSYMSDSYDYDIGVIGAYDCATIASNGYAFDLNSLDGVYLGSSWWDQNASRDLTVHDKLYFTAGDISLTYKLVTHCILFNKEIIKQNSELLNPYELVNSNNWTWDTFASEIRKVGDDLDDNGTYNHLDSFGLMTFNDPTMAVITSANEKIVTVDEDGDLKLTLYTTRSSEAISKYCDILFNEHAFNYQYNYPSSDWNPNRDTIFNDNRALYYMTTFVTVSRHRDKETDFGILPYPKFSSDQESYNHTDTPFSTSFICVPDLVEDELRTGAIVEALAYYSKQYMTPAWYEKTLVGTYVRDDESAVMIDLIFDTRSYDFGTYYNVGSVATQLTSMINSRQNTFASLYAGLKSTAESQLKDINEKYSELK